MSHRADISQQRTAATTMRWLAIANLSDLPMPQETEDMAVLSVLVNALADKHPFVRWQAGRTLASQVAGRQKLLELLKHQTSAPTRPGALQPELQTGLSCSAAIDALAAHPVPGFSPILFEALGAGDPLLRQSAAEALARQGNIEAVPFLVTTALKDPDPWVRRAAVYALGHLGGNNAAPALVKCLTDKAVVVRRSAAYALGALRAEMGLSQLRISLTDQDPQVRRNAAWALGRLGLRETIPDLKHLLDDTALDGTVAAIARQAIQTISRPRWLQILLGTRQHIQ